MLFVRKSLKTPPLKSGAHANTDPFGPHDGVLIEGQATKVADSELDSVEGSEGSKEFVATAVRTDAPVKKAGWLGGLMKKRKVGGDSHEKDRQGPSAQVARPAPAPLAEEAEVVEHGAAAEPSASTPVPESVRVSEQSAKASKLLGRFGKSTKKTEARAPATSKEKPPKPPKPSKEAKPRKGVLYIGADVDEATTAWWELKGDHLTPLDGAPTHGRAVLFSRKDLRFQTAKPLSLTDAISLGFQETGEDVVVVNASRAHGVVYVTPPARIMEMGLDIVPGGLVLEAVAKAHSMTAPCVVGFDLPGDNGRAALLAIGALLPKVGLAKFQLTLNTDNRQFTLNQFVSQQKGFPDGAAVTLFGLAELVAESSKLPAYPKAAMFFGGVSKSAASWIAVGIAGVLAAGGVGAYAYLQAEKGRLAQAVEATVAADRAAKQKVATMVEARVPALIRRATLDVPTIFSQASQLWLPRTKVAVDAVLAEGARVEVTFSPTGGQPGTPSFSASEQEIAEFVGRTEVGACRRDLLNMNGASNEIVATYICENAVVIVPGYSLE